MLFLVSKNIFYSCSYFEKIKQLKIIESGDFVTGVGDETWKVEISKQKQVIETKYRNVVGGEKCWLRKNKVEIVRGLNPSFNIYYFSDNKDIILTDNFKLIVDIIAKAKGKEYMSITNHLLEIFNLRHLVVGETLIKEIKKLPPVSKLTVLNKGGNYILRIKKYPILSQHNISFIKKGVTNYFEKSFLNVLSNMLKIAKEKVNILLSGGIDSTLLAVLVRKCIREKFKNKLKIITHTSPLEFDMKNARFVAEVLGLENKTVKMKTNRYGLIKQFKQFLIENGHPIFHPGFYQINWKKIKCELLLYAQGIEDITLGRREFRVINFLLQKKLSLFPPSLIPSNYGKVGWLKNVLTAMRTSDIKKIFIAMKSLIPLKVKTKVNKLIFLANEINSLHLNLVRKIGLLYLFNGFFSDSLNIDKLIVTPIVNLRLITKLLKIPDNFLIKGNYDRYIERHILKKHNIPRRIFIQKERITWEKQTEEWFKKMKKYLVKTSNKLLDLKIFPYEIIKYLEKKISIEDKKTLYFLASLYEILNYTSQISI